MDHFEVLQPQFQLLNLLLQEGRCDVVANDAGDRVTPAVVGWNDTEVLVRRAPPFFY